MKSFVPLLLRWFRWISRGCWVVVVVRHRFLIMVLIFDLNGQDIIFQGLFQRLQRHVWSKAQQKSVSTIVGISGVTVQSRLDKSDRSMDRNILKLVLKKSYCTIIIHRALFLCIILNCYACQMSVTATTNHTCHVATSHVPAVDCTLQAQLIRIITQDKYSPSTLLLDTVGPITIECR